MHWIALPLPWCDEASAPPAGAVPTAAAGWWALRFTPRVALVDGDTVLLERPGELRRLSIGNGY